MPDPHDYVVEIDVDYGTTSLENLVGPPPLIEVYTEGPQGAKGETGDPGPENLVVSDTDPGLTEPGLWIQTLPGGDMTFWIEDGA